MKKITFLFSFCLLTLGAFAQTVQTFTASGQDDDPTVLTILPGDITVNGANPITALSLTNFSVHYYTPDGDDTWCGSWYDFDLAIVGGAADGTNIIGGCSPDFEIADVLDFTSITLTSNTIDSWSDLIYMYVDLSVTFTASEPPVCNAVLTNPLNGETIASNDGNIEWSAATGGVDGYYLTVGTTSGGSEFLATTDVGNVTTYELGILTGGITYYVNIVPYNPIGSATSCTEYSFTVAEVPGCAINPEPADGAVGVPVGNVTFSWEAPTSGPTPTSYNLYAGETPTGDDYGLIANFTDFNAALTLNGYDLELFWIVKPVNGTTEATGCPVWSFITESAPPTPANNECADAETINCGDTVSGYTTTATDNGGYNASNDVWYVLAGTANGEEITASLCGSDYDTYISVYDACGGNVVAGNDDFCSVQSQVTFTSDGSSTYYIAVEGYGTGSGNFDLAVTCVPPPACVEPTFTIALGANNCPTEEYYVDVVVTNLGTGAAVDISDDSGVIQTAVGLGSYSFGPYAAATDVNITVEDAAGDTCSATDSITTPLACPPANDLCVNAEIVYCGDVINGSTISATDTGNNASNDVWYSLAGTTDGEEISISLCGSDFDTYLRVFDACSGTEVVSNDDDFCDGSIAVQSAVTFTSDGTSTYYIMVEGYSSNNGNFVLTVGTCSTVGIEEYNASELFSYYPNPVNSTLNLRGQKAIQNVAIYNMLGQEVLRTSPNAVDSALDMSSLNAGTYFVKVTIENITKTIKVIKK
ncbi:T9SS type A sorting domain-containing protein [Bizionia arctica]|uniref:T9SS C-terminal target domain-containing protein n=1 Tax=Bizionia arctica TaxID=1495645 RepID=A0A917GFI9_9FLAO|nr:T9SS type A sorting domain-containing protein [Bizionia arctica]GGG43020.1 T9SS C-terminal target domain-containing protein [Bizionia arctica]